jgi:sn-glycerol 3-phosphate transport system ATP-binding protein
MAHVKLRDVYKKFGKTEVIHGINCDIEDGQFVVILGPSGCGKSTVLRLIAGLEELTSGEVSIDDKVVNRLEPANRDVAMVFQNYALYPHMSVYKNMAYGLKIRHMPKVEIEQRVRAAAEILEIGELLDRKPRELSGGQRQRVAMGRCIVREPKVFLFDEPLSNLDAKLRVQMRLEIRSLHERLNITSIYVTHDQVEAMTLGDRLVVMNDGYVAQIGTPLDVYECPANRFVAGFIGSPAMNFVPARLSEDCSSVTVQETIRLPLEGRPEADVGRDVILGIRPEHLEEAPESEASIELRVDHVEILGADTLVYGHIGEARSQPITVRIPESRRFERQRVLGLKTPASKLHLFDPETGNRIRCGPPALQEPLDPTETADANGESG